MLVRMYTTVTNTTPITLARGRFLYNTKHEHDEPMDTIPLH